MVRTNFSNSISFKELIDRINKDEKPLGGNVPTLVYIDLDHAKTLAKVSIALEGILDSLDKKCTSVSQFNDVT